MLRMKWLPEAADWRARVATLSGHGAQAWREACQLAGHDLDFLQTNALDTAWQACLKAGAPVPARPVRLLMLGSSTLGHLAAAIRVAGLRHGLHVEVRCGEHGQYRQALSAPSPELDAYAPDVVLLALDAHHLCAGLQPGQSDEDWMAQVQADCRALWQQARQRWGCLVVHQTAMPVHPGLMGSQEHRLPGSPAAFLRRLNGRLRAWADQEHVQLLALDDQVAQQGLAAWHDRGLWHRAKQETTPTAAPMFGELLARILAARWGRTRKCLVLDLDHTLWGGVVGDVGAQGLVLGAGSALGEAYGAVQQYVKALSARGVVLAVCSKNDAASALEPFHHHPDMVLRETDVACFVANWDDKPGNLRRIAAELNLGLEALVFLDDNPFERELVRRELPMVAVPEVSDDPVVILERLASAGYFESLDLTDEDRRRAGQYQENRQRAALQSITTDLSGYLRSLEMQLHWRRFDEMGLARVVQLIGKSNQFNLTTRRYGEADIRQVMGDPAAFGLQLRLRDRLGDSGMIAVVIGRLEADATVVLDTWLMSCRVLGREVERATLNVVIEQARRLGARRLVGHYRHTSRNSMVADHYARLGFHPLDARETGDSSWELVLSESASLETFIQVIEEADHEDGSRGFRRIDGDFPGRLHA